MTHIRINGLNMFAVEMVRAALAHPIVTHWHPDTIWRHVDIVSNEVIACTIKVRRHGETDDITAHCDDMEFKGNTVIRGALQLTIGHRDWSFSGHLVGDQIEVQGKLVSE